MTSTYNSEWFSTQTASGLSIEIPPPPILIHASLSLMTFLRSNAAGFQFQTTLIKRENKNLAAFHCVRSAVLPAFSALVIFTGNE